MEFVHVDDFEGRCFACGDQNYDYWPRVDEKAYSQVVNMAISTNMDGSSFRKFIGRGFKVAVAKILFVDKHGETKELEPWNNIGDLCIADAKRRKISMRIVGHLSGKVRDSIMMLKIFVFLFGQRRLQSLTTNSFQPGASVIIGFIPHSHSDYHFLSLKLGVVDGAKDGKYISVIFPKFDDFSPIKSANRFAINEELIVVCGFCFLFVSIFQKICFRSRWDQNGCGRETKTGRKMIVMMIGC